MNRKDVFEKVYDSYCTWYDMEKSGEEKTPLTAVGAFHESSSSYMLTEKATMWTADRHDYLYIYDLPTLDSDTFADLLSSAKEAGEKFINPDKKHKCSYITVLFICDSADPAAITALTKYKFRKDFNFGLRGWEEVHTALICADDGSIRANKDGIHTEKFLNSIFYPKKKGLLNKLKGV